MRSPSPALFGHGNVDAGAKSAYFAPASAVRLALPPIAPAEGLPAAPRFHSSRRTPHRADHFRRLAARLGLRPGGRQPPPARSPLMSPSRGPETPTSAREVSPAQCINPNGKCLVEEVASGSDQPTPAPFWSSFRTPTSWQKRLGNRWRLAPGKNNHALR